MREKWKKIVRQTSISSVYYRYKAQASMQTRNTHEDGTNVCVLVRWWRWTNPHVDRWRIVTVGLARLIPSSTTHRVIVRIIISPFDVKPAPIWSMDDALHGVLARFNFECPLPRCTMPLWERFSFPKISTTDNPTRIKSLSVARGERLYCTKVIPLIRSHHQWLVPGESSPFTWISYSDSNLIRCPAIIPPFLCIVPLHLITAIHCTKIWSSLENSS